MADLPQGAARLPPDSPAEANASLHDSAGAQPGVDAAAAPSLRTRLWQRRFPWLLLLLALALVYYGSYVRHGINFRDEGGTVALLAKRLLAGERPFLDLVLGYNVGWFYPVVGLFKLFGVNFVLLRGYCFALSTLTALLAFLTVERASRRPWLAFLVALLVVLVPGMTFKNYMPLLAVANGYCLLHFVLARRLAHGFRDASSTPSSSKLPLLSWPRLTAGSLVLGATFLIRIDVGMFCLILWLGSFVILGLRRCLSVRARATLLLGCPALLIALVLAVHAPIYLDAVHRGFGRPLVVPYIAWPASIATSIQERLYPPSAPSPRRLQTAPAPAQGDAPHASGDRKTSWNTEGLRRKTLLDLGTARDGEERALILLVYAPLLTLLPLALWAGVATTGALRRPEQDALARPLAALLVVGAAFTTFAQYFFFRPDSPHVSEFSPGYWVATFSATMLLGFPATQTTSRWARRGGALLLGILTLHAGLYLLRMMPDRWTGTIAARKGRNILFHGENGVDVYVSKREYEGLQKLLTLVRTHSGESSDYLLAYPYHPSLNLLCDRRAYEKNLYIDNATREPGWNQHAIQRIQKFRPNVIILSDWDINGTEASRFSVWAEPTKTWIQTHYLSQGTYLDFEVFTRPEKEE